MNKKEKEIFTVFKDFIKYQRKQEINSGLVEKDDLSVLYRFINKIGGWKAIQKNKGDLNGNNKKIFA